MPAQVLDITDRINDKRRQEQLKTVSPGALSVQAIARKTARDAIPILSRLEVIELIRFAANYYEINADDIFLPEGDRN